MGCRLSQDWQANLPIIHRPTMPFIWSKSGHERNNGRNNFGNLTESGMPIKAKELYVTTFRMNQNYKLMYTLQQKSVEIL